MSDRIALAAFQACLGPGFSMLLANGQRLQLELVTVRDLGARQAGGGTLDCYSLVFRSRGEKRAAPQATYRIEQAVLGALEMFLVPIGPDLEGMQYEAIFN